MSECVVRMEMPKNCGECPICETASGGNELYKLWGMCGGIPASAQRRPDDCPILCQLPEGHGRLIDATSRVMVPMDEDGEPTEMSVDFLLDYVTPFVETIVPAERSET